MILMIQSGHKFAHVTTAQLSWHVQNCDLVSYLFIKQKQHDFLQDLGYELINLSWNGSLDPGNLLNENEDKLTFYLAPRKRNTMVLIN